ncbi:MAG: hypothetical protein LBU12_05055 [Deltaproteobacteria bacterium]|nr:hypothetical protein [Deltaproteobacteria bacterium]
MLAKTLTFLLLWPLAWSASAAAQEPAAGSQAAESRPAGPPMPPSTRFHGLASSPGHVAAPPNPAAESSLRRDDVIPANPPSSDGPRYFRQEDQAAWAQAADDLTRGLQAEFLRRGAWGAPQVEALEAVFGYVDDRLEVRLSLQPEMTVEEQDALSLSLIRQYVDDRLEAIALDESGAYFVMSRGELAGEGEWLWTSIAAVSLADGAPSPGEPSEKPGGPSAGAPNSDERRFRAATEAWRNSSGSTP